MEIQDEMAERAYELLLAPEDECCLILDIGKKSQSTSSDFFLILQHRLWKRIEWRRSWGKRSSLDWNRHLEVNVGCSAWERSRRRFGSRWHGRRHAVQSGYIWWRNFDISPAVALQRRQNTSRSAQETVPVLHHTVRLPGEWLNNRSDFIQYSLPVFSTFRPEALDVSSSFTQKTLSKLRWSRARRCEPVSTAELLSIFPTLRRRRSTSSSWWLEATNSFPLDSAPKKTLTKFHTQRSARWPRTSGERIRRNHSTGSCTRRSEEDKRATKLELTPSTRPENAVESSNFVI